jgi:hypothetical protein
VHGNSDAIPAGPTDWKHLRYSATVPWVLTLSGAESKVFTLQQQATVTSKNPEARLQPVRLSPLMVTDTQLPLDAHRVSSLPISEHGAGRMEEIALRGADCYTRHTLLRRSNEGEMLATCSIEERGDMGTR